MERSTLIFSPLFLCVICNASVFLQPIKKPNSKFCEGKKKAIIFFCQFISPLAHLRPVSRESETSEFLQIHLENAILNWFSLARRIGVVDKTESYCSLVRNGSSVGSFVRTAHERRVKKKRTKWFSSPLTGFGGSLRNVF